MKNNAIHPTALIDPSAEIAEGVEMGPYTVIGPETRIGPGTKIGAHVIIEKWVNLGSNCRICHGAVLGGAPQIIGYQEKKSFVNIGDRTVIGEFVTVHRSGKEGGATDIGNECFLMAYSHVAHDGKLGNKVVIVNYTAVTGHVQIGDQATISGYVGIHQFVRIGRLAMVSGLSRIPKDILPYSLVEGNPASVRGLNVVGMKRSGIPQERRKHLKHAFKLLLWSGLNTTQALVKIREEMEVKEEVEEIVNFVESSDRGILK